MTNKATDKPLTLQECKDKVAEKHNLTNWGYACFVWAGFVKMMEPKMDEAAELYKDSAIEAQKEEIDRLKEGAQQWKNTTEYYQKEIEALKQALKQAHNLPPYL